MSVTAFPDTPYRPDAEKVKAPAIGVSLTLDLGGSAHMVLQTHFDQELPIPDQNRLLDQLYAAAQRQKAKAEIVILRKTIEVQQRSIKDSNDRLKEAEETHERQVATIKEQIGAYIDQRDEIQASGAKEHADSGRRGVYKIGGQRTQRMSVVDKAIEAKEAEIEKLGIERLHARHAEKISMESCEREIMTCGKEIEERNALIAGSPGSPSG